MNFSVVTGNLTARKGALILGIAEDSALPAWAAHWSGPVRKAVQELLKAKRFRGKLNETFLFPIGSQWVILIGVGKKDELTLEKVRQAAATASRCALAAGFE